MRSLLQRLSVYLPHLYTVLWSVYCRLNGVGESIKLWQRQEILGNRIAKRGWEKRGVQTDVEGEKWNKARRKMLRRLSGACLSVVSTEPLPKNTDTAAVCISLPRTAVTPVWTALICNTIILAHIPGYITLRAEFWPQSEIQSVLHWSEC